MGAVRLGTEDTQQASFLLQDFDFSRKREPQPQKGAPGVDVSASQNPCSRPRNAVNVPGCLCSCDCAACILEGGALGMLLGYFGLPLVLTVGII